jgi:predicted DNA-binding transcriptional regulator AlpA
MLLDLDISAIPTDQLLPTLTRLAALQSQVAARLMATPAPEPAADEPDRWLTTAQVAERLQCSLKHIYRHQKSWPFAKKLSAKQWRFSERGLEKWLSRKK